MHAKKRLVAESRLDAFYIPKEKNLYRCFEAVAVLLSHADRGL